jgi:DNA-binding NtrC family response regulator
MNAKLPLRSEPDLERQKWNCKIKASCWDLQSARQKLWKLADDPFSVLGEARVVEHDLAFTILGDFPPEPRLGLAAGSFPKTLTEALALMHEEDREAFQVALQQSLQNGQPFNLSYRLADGLGGWRWIEGRAVSVEERAGRHVGWFFVNRDFTRQRQTEAALHQALEDLAASRRALQSEHDKLWQLAANTFSLLCEIKINETGMHLEYLGEPPPEAKLGLLPGTAPKTIEAAIPMLHPDDRDHFQEQVRHAVATGEPARLVYRLTDGRGGWRWIRSRAVCIQPNNGRHWHWVADSVDITELKEAEEALRHSLEELRQLKSKLQSENLLLRREVRQTSDQSDIVGQSAALHRVLEQVELVAPTASTVLISGETGTGKELIARAIHQRSRRNQQLFVAVNCAALPATLVESELFGHEKGAFTGAINRRVGRFEQADGGTLFLDEIGELPLATQAKMLRALQLGEFERVGGSRPLKVSVRVIAASNRNLEQAVREGQFRSDLYHRLAIFPIHLPPLRERREDIPLLAAYLVTRKARQLGRKIEWIPNSLLHRLAAYDWPGNIRELENVLERAIILSPGPELKLEANHLSAVDPARIPEAAKPMPIDPANENDITLRTFEREHIRRTCEASHWKIKGPNGAAQKLGLNPGTLYSRMKKLGLRRPTAH